MRNTIFFKMINDFIKDIAGNHKRFYGKIPKYFNGPTLYFHLESLNSRHCPVLFAKNSYAMLACWGMHRMGPNGPKMKDFSIYEKSLHDIWPDICELQGYSLENLADKQWKKLENCFSKIEIMEGDCILVGHSKVLAHLLPNIVPPIDRTHTLKFLGVTIYPVESREEQLGKFQEILKVFFLETLKSDSFKKYHQKVLLQNQPWATSPLKCIDNLILVL